MGQGIYEGRSVKLEQEAKAHVEGTRIKFYDELAQHAEALENHIKSNLIIFVTAEIIDATGKRVNGGDTATAPPVGGGAADTALPSLPGD